MADKHKAKRAKKQYKAQLVALQFERDQLGTALRYEAQLVAQQSELDQLSAALEQYKAQLVAMQLERDQLGAALRYEAQLVALRSERDQLKATLEHKAQLVALRSERDQLKATLEHKAQLVALQSEREQLRAALEAVRSSHDPAPVPDYEWHVELAAKGLAQRDKRPMPMSVTTPEEFYEVMAGAALEATGLRALLERLARAERELEIQDALSPADAKAQNQPSPGEDRGGR
jgi:hypothetical protein